MFLPNTTGSLSRRTGVDMYSQPSFSAPKTVLCGIVHLRSAAEKTSVRTDSSATRGNAQETVAAAKILFPANVEIGIGDHFVIAGVKLRATAREPRIDVTGRLDHIEVDFEIWN